MVSSRVPMDSSSKESQPIEESLVQENMGGGTHKYVVAKKDLPQGD
jgi:hypothetical protein